MFSKILPKYKSFLKTNPETYFSPGRVNLVGEHIDYLGGRVFPTAITLGTYAFVTKRNDEDFHFISDNFSEEGVKLVEQQSLGYDEARNWANYPTGMIQAFKQMGHQFPFGLNILIYGTLPNGAGLSSSASLEVLMGVILNETYSLGIDMIDIVTTAQRVENEYIGVNCGIMDQFAVGMSKKNTAIYLDTNTLDYDLIPLELGQYVIVIANTNKQRTLAGSKYNERRRECDQGLIDVQSHFPEITQLCDLSIDSFHEIEDAFQFEHIKHRVRHAVTETDRTNKAVEALIVNDIKLFAKLMNESHESLKNDYEVSCKELDVLVDSFRNHGAIGARMTGAGFGGSIVSIVHQDIVDNLIQKVTKEYQEKTEFSADFYICETSNGTRKI